MFILCCGPDSYRAIARAKEFELGFKQKYDPEGHSVERLSSGKEGVEEIISKAAGASLFSPRRFLRVDGIVSSCPKSKQHALLEALSRDADSLIVVSVEEVKPPVSTLKLFESLPKILVQEYLFLTDRAFLEWAKTIVKTLGNVDENDALVLAKSCSGDSWRFINELTKLSAGAPINVDSVFADANVFQLADQIVQGQNQRRFTVDSMELRYQELAGLHQQFVNVLRVRDRDFAGLSPFVINKLQSQKFLYAEASLLAIVKMLLLQRAGYCTEEESKALIP